MATKTTTEIKQELDDLLMEDTVDDAPWTADRKRRALNRAIRAAWPNFKLAKEDATTVTLLANTFKYALTTLTDIEDIGAGRGICQALLQPSDVDADYAPLRRCAQSRDATGWNLYVPADLVPANIGRKIKLRYYARLAEIPLPWSGAETIPAEIANFVVYSAAADLFGIYAQGGSDFNVDDMLKLIPLYQARAKDELQRATVYTMPVYVGLRKEGGQ